MAYTSENLTEDNAGAGGNGNDDQDQLASMEPVVPRGRRGRHSRSASFFGGIVDVLTIIDEVEADPVGAHLPDGASSVGGSHHYGGGGADDESEHGAAASASGAASSIGMPSPASSAGLRHRHRLGMHSRGMSLTEGIFEEVLEVKDAFVEELTEADAGDTYLLDMSMARGMAILPDDMIRVAEATAPEMLAEMLVDEEGFDYETGKPYPGGVTEGEKLPLLEGKEEPAAAAPSTGIPLSAYVLLATAVIALSSIGPLLNLQKGIHPILKIYWRMSATAMTLSPLAAISVYHEGLPQTLDHTKKITLLLTAACYATMCVGFVLALQYTAVGNAVILSNSQSVLLLFGKLFVGQRILCLEATGALFAFAGAALCSMDSAHSSSSSSEGGATASAGNSHMTLFGDLLALASATGGVFYLTFAKTVRPHVALYQFMFLVMFLGSSLILLFLFLFTNVELTVDRNLTTGIWGWMNWQPDRLPLELTMVVLCNLFGAMGYIRAMQYFDNLIIAVAALMEPAVAELMAAAVGVDQLPGAMGWAGNIMVFAGTFAVVYPSAKGGHKDAGGH